MARISVVIFAILICGAICEDDGSVNPRAVEEGRTLVHHAMKRLSLLLPAFMFKLGIMFTMILVSMITSTKGLLVGTLLLALGIGHFIASKFSAVPGPVALTLPSAHVHSLPVSHAVPHSVPHVAHWVDRSDSVQGGNSVGTLPAGYGGYGQSQAYSAWKQY